MSSKNQFVSFFSFCGRRGVKSKMLACGAVLKCRTDAHTMAYICTHADPPTQLNQSSVTFQAVGRRGSDLNEIQLTRTSLRVHTALHRKNNPENLAIWFWESTMTSEIVFNATCTHLIKNFNLSNIYSLF